MWKGCEPTNGIPDPLATALLQSMKILAAKNDLSIILFYSPPTFTDARHGVPAIGDANRSKGKCRKVKRSK